MLPDASGPPPLSARFYFSSEGFPLPRNSSKSSLSRKKSNREISAGDHRTPPECLPPRPLGGFGLQAFTSGLHLGCGQRRLGPSPQAPSLGLLHLSQWLQPTAFARKTRPSGLRITNGAFRFPSRAAGLFQADSPRFTPQAAPPHEYANKAGDSRPPFWAGPRAVP